MTWPRSLRELVVLVTALLALPGTGAMADAPKRVVSMNVCTDQLALLVADKGRIASVSYLAHDPSVSVLADAAAALPANHGLAEEIFLLEPDLVLAGTFTTRTTVAMLRRLGIRVEEFAPEENFADIRKNILRMGEILERREKAQDLVKELDDGLAAIPAEGGSRRPSAALLAANGYTVGTGTLADAIITAAGFRNLAAELGYSGTAKLPIETLILHDPDLLIVDDGDDYPPALAHELLDHPALRKAFAGKRQVASEGRYWICGAPFTLRAVEALARQRLSQGTP